MTTNRRTLRRLERECRKKRATPPCIVFQEYGTERVMYDGIIYESSDELYKHVKPERLIVLCWMYDKLEDRPPNN